MRKYTIASYPAGITRSAHLALVAEAKMKNKKNTSDLECPHCDTWLEHWTDNITEKLNISDNKAFELSEMCHAHHGNNRNCMGDEDIVGAHVIPVDMVDSENGYGFILPLCNSCNLKKHKLTFELSEDEEKYLVSANPDDCCMKE